MFHPVRISTTSREFVTLAEAKKHCRVDHSDEDDLIAALITTATDLLDGWSGLCGRCLVEQRWRQRFDGFAPAMMLPFPDVKSVEVIGYRDAAGVPQTLALSSIYPVADAARAALVTFKPGISFPATDSSPDPVHLDFTAGYGTADKVPGPIRAAALILIGALYDTRGHAAGSFKAPPIVDQLIAPFRAQRVG